MDQQKNTNLRHAEQYLGVLVLGFLLGGGFSFTYFNQAGNKSYQEGFDAAKKVVLESRFGGAFVVPDEIKTISGKVLEISENRITIETQSNNPFDVVSKRTVFIDNDTRIYSLSQKDPKVMQSEMDEFMKAVREGKNSPPPQPYASSKASIEEIKIGDIINVTATNNVKTLAEFTASEIQIEVKPITQ
ncbi:MAG: hypothetical protein WC724_03005 [Candidatus Paceibacterota bacterium]|jgi:hypothetical protein